MSTYLYKGRHRLAQGRHRVRTPRRGLHLQVGYLVVALVAIVVTTFAAPFDVPGTHGV